MKPKIHLYGLFCREKRSVFSLGIDISRKRQDYIDVGFGLLFWLLVCTWEYPR